MDTAVICLASPEIVHDDIPTSTVALTTCITLTVHWRLAAASQGRRQDALENTDQSLTQRWQGGDQYTQRELRLGPDRDIDTIPGRVLCCKDRAKLYSLEYGAYGGTALNVSAADARRSWTEVRGDLRNTQQEHHTYTPLRPCRKLYVRQVDQRRSHVDNVCDYVADALCIRQFQTSYGPAFIAPLIREVPIFLKRDAAQERQNRGEEV